jgi:hypothetical protein
MNRNGKIPLINRNKKHVRRCPDCNKEIVYRQQSSYCDAKRNNSICRLCSYSSDSIRLKRSLSHKGKPSGFKGKRHAIESKIQMSKWHIGKIVSNVTKDKLSNRIVKEETKTKMSIAAKNHWKNPTTRKKMIDGSKWVNVKLDKGQLELLEKWNRLGFNFEPNYKIKIDSDLFYIDGYDIKNNVVLEYDGKYHNRRQQKQKDIIRQQKIVFLLKPRKFWRYNSERKQFTMIL